MPSVKIPRKSTDTDMTPFVDIAFLILSFFIMATKFKPPEPVEIKTPGSVLSQKLPENNAVLITIDSTNRVYFSVMSEKDKTKYDAIINDINTTQSLGLTPAEIQNYRQTYAVGVPFGGLKQLLATNFKDQPSLKQPGIPVLDTLNNQLVHWIGAAKRAFAGEKGFKYLIKGDGHSKYPTFEAVISALKKNDEFKYNLVTALDDVPSGSEFSKAQYFVPENKK
ncbi:MAG: biopolymer transporter ExbD [Chitinophagaceae bacterium]|nr:biopolymer transporter ExbD [Chitinophagaceae bacterium]